MGTAPPPFVGLISDTHGLLREEALAALRGAELILHAGDVCDPGVLEELAKLAPVLAVRGNNDRGAWAEALPERRSLEVRGVPVLMIHDAKELGGEARGARVVVAGHSHKPRVEERGGVLWVNPGSAGPRRFSLPVTLGRLVVVDGAPRVDIVELSVPSAKRRR